MKLKYICLLFLAFILNKISAQNTEYERVKKFIITAAQLDTFKTIWVYLPKNYQNSKKFFLY